MSLKSDTDIVLFPNLFSALLLSNSPTFQSVYSNHDEHICAVVMLLHPKPVKSRIHSSQFLLTVNVSQVIISKMTQPNE